MILLVVNISYADDEGIDSENFFDSIFSRISNVLTGMAVGDLLLPDLKKEKEESVLIPSVPEPEPQTVPEPEPQNVPEPEPQTVPEPEPELPQKDPFIKLSSAGGKVDDKIKITGADFPLLDLSFLDVLKSTIGISKKMIVIFFDEKEVVRTKYKVHFEEYFKVPSMPEGEYKITVGGFPTAVADFVIRTDEDANIVIYPDYGSVDNKIKITGKKFPLGIDMNTLSIKWDDEDFKKISYPFETGEFEIYVTVPKINEEIKKSKITVDEFPTAVADFNIKESYEPLLEILSADIYEGDNISVVGINFPQGNMHYLSLIMDNVILKKFIYDGTGSFEEYIIVPDIVGETFIEVMGFPSSKIYVNILGVEGEVVEEVGDIEDEVGEDETIEEDEEDFEEKIESIVITAKVVDNIISETCISNCYEACGQLDGCGYYCPSYELNIEGKCGNPILSTNFQKANNRVTENIENFFSKWMFKGLD